MMSGQLLFIVEKLMVVPQNRFPILAVLESI